MSNGSKYFIGNWKMFGISGSFKILDRINRYFQKDKKSNRKYKVIMALPFTLLQDFSQRYKNKKIIVSAQNCYHKDNFGAHTGNISPFMIKKMGVNYIIIGHSENRASGETDKIIEEKVSLADLEKAVECPLCESLNTKRTIGITMIFKKQNSQSSNVASQNTTRGRHRSSCPCC